MVASPFLLASPSSIKIITNCVYPEIVNKYTYLGIILGENLTFRNDVNYLNSTIANKLYILRYILQKLK